MSINNPSIASNSVIGKCRLSGTSTQTKTFSINAGQLNINSILRITNLHMRPSATGTGYSSTIILNIGGTNYNLTGESAGNNYSQTWIIAQDILTNTVIMWQDLAGYFDSSTSTFIVLNTGTTGITTGTANWISSAFTITCQNQSDGSHTIEDVFLIEAL